MKLTRQRRFDRLADLDAAAGKMPAGPVAVADQQHAVAVPDHEPLRPERHQIAPAAHPIEQLETHVFKPRVFS